MPRYRMTLISEDEYYLHEEEFNATNSVTAWNEAYTTAEELWPDTSGYEVEVVRLPE